MAVQQVLTKSIGFAILCLLLILPQFEVHSHPLSVKDPLRRQKRSGTADIILAHLYHSHLDKKSVLREPGDNERRQIKFWNETPSKRRKNLRPKTFAKHIRKLASHRHRHHPHRESE